jgi:hypothetical protein
VFDLVNGVVDEKMVVATVAQVVVIDAFAGGVATAECHLVVCVWLVALGLEGSGRVETGSGEDCCGVWMGVVWVLVALVVVVM